MTRTSTAGILSDDPAMAGRNFANMLAVLDVLVPEDQPASFGIRGHVVPKGFVGQMVAPFVTSCSGARKTARNHRAMRVPRSKPRRPNARALPSPSISL